MFFKSLGVVSHHGYAIDGIFVLLLSGVAKNYSKKAITTVTAQASCLEINNRDCGGLVKFKRLIPEGEQPEAFWSFRLHPTNSDRCQLATNSSHVHILGTKVRTYLLRWRIPLGIPPT